MTQSPTRIAIGHPGMGFGGSEARVMSLLEMLQNKFQVDLITTNMPDLQKLNDFYQTNVKREKIKIHLVPIPLFVQNSTKYSALRSALYNRFTKKIGAKYDLCISAYNLTHWGECRRKIHFIADFGWDRELYRSLSNRSLQDRSLNFYDSILQKCYFRFCKMIHAVDLARHCISQNDLFLLNSQWSKDVFESKYGPHRGEVVFPAVREQYTKIAKERRKADFVSLGRIAPEKRIIEQIEIIQLLRECGFATKLHIIGEVGKDPYGKQVSSLCKDKDWVILHGKCYGKKKANLLTSCRYAIHCCQNEAFGIAVAEFVRAGCIPFVPQNGGGPTEIVPFIELQFTDHSDAVNKIINVLSNPELESIIYNNLNNFTSSFSVEEFEQKVFSHIEEELA